MKNQRNILTQSIFILLISLIFYTIISNQVIINTLGFIFSIMFIISLIGNVYQVYNKKLRKEHYLFIYFEYLSILILLSFIFILLDQNVFYSIIIVSLTDIMIKIYFQININSGKKIAKRMNVLKIKRTHNHSISKKLYFFKDFKCHIEDISKFIPTLNYINFNLFFKDLKLETLKNQFGSNKVYSFEIYMKEKKKRFFKEIGGVLKDNSIIKDLEEINSSIKFKSSIKTALVTYYSKRPLTRICIDKDFCDKNPEKVYQLLKSYVIQN